MKKGETFYITTTIPYVNADPHIGFALEVVQADVLARHYRSLYGADNVFFNQGADEHGQKIWEKAQETGVDVQVYVDKYAASVKTLKKTLDLSNDAFVRTTDTAHEASAQELWRRCEKNGDIEKRKYRGLYCVGCEKFLAERDLEDGKCPLHPNQKPVMLEEENYFFKVTNYQTYLEEYLSKADVIVPKHRLEEARQFVRNGLEDFSISREKEKLPWGVPVPGDDTQVMYVWFDALTNYISTLDWPEDKEDKYKKFWEEGMTLQIAGKDQIRFQSIMWQAMLKSAGLPATDQIFYHGFINSGGHRMSKSLGNVISPFEMVEKYGTDATRYLLLRHVHSTDDTDVTWERLDEWYTANLVNGLGNLVARVMQMAVTHLQSPAEMTKETQPDPDVAVHIEAFEFNRAMDSIWERIGHNDALIALNKPFAGAVSNEAAVRDEALAVVKKLERELHAIAIELEPFMPETARKIKNAVKENKKPQNLFPRIEIT